MPEMQKKSGVTTLEFLCFWSANREPVKELIYQKKNGGYQASKRVISHNASKQPPTSGVGALYIP